MSSHESVAGLLQSVQEAYPNLLDTQVLKTLFPSLFLALVARDTNIIIQTPQPAELQRSTEKVLSTVFGLQTKRVTVRSSQSPHEFLESFFVSTSSHGSFSSPSKSKSSRTSVARSLSSPRPTSTHFTEGSDSNAHPSHLPRHKADPLPDVADSRSLYLPQGVVISNLERAGRAVHLTLADVLRNRQIVLDTAVWNLPDGFFIVYVSQLGDGYERPAIHTTLLDHFAFSITLSQTAAAMPTSSPSPRTIPLPISPQAPKPPLFPHDRLPLSNKTHISPMVSHYINALISAARHHPELEGTFLTVRCVRDAERLVRAAGLVFREGEHMITEAHVRRVMPPILAHRLRVRDGPRDQIMGILWEGAGVQNWGQPEVKTQQSRRTIKAILAEILAEV